MITKPKQTESLTDFHQDLRAQTTKNSLNRRQVLAQCVASAALLCFPTLCCAQAKIDEKLNGQKTTATGNFKAIYQDEVLKERFKLFLVHVYHLYPEIPFHHLIERLTQKYSDDRSIYEGLLEGLPEIQPFLASFRYALPSLAEQKRMIQAQTLTLLEGKKEFERYLSVGTTGRYYGGLSEVLNFERDPIFVSYQAPSYGIAEIVERGQFSKMGQFYDLSDYQPLSANIPNDSIDLMTVYIGFHHASLARREAFMASCARVLKPGGSLIVRDHDAYSPEYVHMVALAHDVFNAGLGVSWADNEAEVRHFMSLETLSGLLRQQGLTQVGSNLLQIGDPTINTLMRFDKLG